MALIDEGPHVAVEEGEQQRSDVVAVGVGVHQQDDFVIAQQAQVEVLAQSAPQRLHHVREFFVGLHLFHRGLLGV